MKRDNVFNIIAIAAALLMILSVFLPYVTHYSTSLSLWKMEDPSRYIYLFLGVMVIVFYLVNMKTELSYLAVGFSLFTSVSKIIAIGGFNGLSIGFYLILASSIIILLITFLYNENESIPLIGDDSEDEFNEEENYTNV